MGPRGAKMEPKWRQDGVKTAKKSEKNTNATKKRVASHSVPPGAEKVANMAPTWVPKWSLNGEKIDAKIDQKFDASWDRFLERFWWILEGKMEASWDPKSSKNQSRR